MLESRDLHHPWVYPPDTPKAYRAYLARARRPDFKAFLVRRTSDGALAGVINVSQIVLSNFRSAYLGYYGSAPLRGQGYMAEGLRLLVRHAFTKLGLHRLEANVQPANTDSITLLRRCAFRKEGFSPRYLKIAGRWRDHDRWTLLSDTPGGP